MATTGTVRFWNTGEGWGVIDSAETPTGCWAHFTHIRTNTSAFRTLAAAQPVEFTWEEYPQDGYEFRAIEVWPAVNA